MRKELKFLFTCWLCRLKNVPEQYSIQIKRCSHRWSEAECVRQQLPVTPENQRSVLGRALALVRFPLMSVEEFAAGPAQSGLLTDREVFQKFVYKKSRL